jgi:hypothetical protein
VPGRTRAAPDRCKIRTLATESRCARPVSLFVRPDRWRRVTVRRQVSASARCSRHRVSGGTPAGFGLCASGTGWWDWSPPNPRGDHRPDRCPRSLSVGSDPCWVRTVAKVGAAAPHSKWRLSSSVVSRPTGGQERSGSARRTRTTRPSTGSRRKPAEPDTAADAACVRHRRGITRDRLPAVGRAPRS